MNDGTFLPSLLAEQAGGSKLAHHLGRTFRLPHVCVLTETSHGLLSKPYVLVILKLIRCEPVTSAGGGQAWPLVFFYSIKI